MASLFYYNIDSSFVIGVQDQIIGSPVVLRELSKVTDYSQVLWEYNQLTGYLQLASTVGSLQPLIAAPANGGTGSQTLIQLAGQNSAPAYKWSFLQSPGFMYNKGATQMVLDNKGRVSADNNPLWLYPYNGSQAQMWIRNQLTQVEEEMAEKALEDA